MKPERLARVLVVVSVLAVALSLWAFLDQDGPGRDKVLQELPKATWQFLLVVVLGGFVSYLLNQR